MQQPIEDVICVTTMRCGIIDKIAVFIKRKDDETVVKQAEDEFRRVAKKLNSSITSEDMDNALENGYYLSPNECDDVWITWAKIGNKETINEG